MEKMIKVERGTVIFKGPLEDLCAEMTMVLNRFKKTLVDCKGEERAEKLFASVIEDAQKSPEELKKEIERLLRDELGEFGELLAAILGKVGKDNGSK